MNPASIRIIIVPGFFINLTYGKPEGDRRLCCDFDRERNRIVVFSVDVLTFYRNLLLILLVILSLWLNPLDVLSKDKFIIA